MKVLVTGANGFVGKSLVNMLAKKREYKVLAMVHRATELPVCTEQVVTDLCNEIDWVPLLSGVNVVVHLAGRAHVLHDKEKDPLSVYRCVNVEATRRLAQCAADAGVRRFLFVSTIKVNGEHTNGRGPFTNNEAARPLDPYSVSKYEAEQALRDITSRSDMELVIIRPPLIYGPGVKGNFETMLDWLAKGIPLPLGAVDNRRSLLALDNFCEFLSLCIVHPDIGGQILLISDGEDLSTTELIETLKEGMHSHAWLVPLPVGMLKILARLTGLSTTADRLLGNLQVDPAETFRLLGWRPSRSTRELLRETAIQYSSRKK
jgi:nucleoside-diphosphate-sugar epimerase